MYIGETGISLETRLDEHKHDVEDNSNSTRFTRSQRKSSLTQMNKSAVTDHVMRNNHVIDCMGEHQTDPKGN